MTEGRTVETDRAARRRPDAYDGAHQRRLANTARPNDAKRLTRHEAEANIFDYDFFGTGRRDRGQLHVQLFGRRR